MATDRGDCYEDGEYLCRQNGDDPDVFVVRSPYFTFAQFCYPYFTPAPDAYHLDHPTDDPTDDGERTYCYGHDWFAGGGAPYPVYSVATGELVPPPVK